jgi:DNA methyltransferase 1-associated protein 1
LYDSVRKDALTLITLQKMVIQKEAQLQNKRLRLAKMGGGGRIVDEEALLGIAPPPAPPAPAPATSRSKSTGSKTKKSSKAKVSKTGEQKADIAAARAAIKAAPGGKAAPGKQGRKGGTKRKKKLEKTTAAISSAAPTAAIETAVKGDEKPPAKKRVRKG